MLQKSQNDSSLAEELPYWDFFDFPKPHLILNDGSVVAGLSMQLIDIECLDDWSAVVELEANQHR